MEGGSPPVERAGAENKILHADGSRLRPSAVRLLRLQWKSIESLILFPQTLLPVVLPQTALPLSPGPAESPSLRGIGVVEVLGDLEISVSISQVRAVGSR